MEPKPKGKQGFAAMDREKVREIAAKGGRVAHAMGVAHEFTSEEARVHGRKGGQKTARDKAHMKAIGAIGGSTPKTPRRPDETPDEDERDRT